MKMYIKLGFEWELFEEKEHVWIGNSLTNKLFKIEQKEKKEIIKEISNGTTEQELINKFSVDVWDGFKEELENNKVICYSEYQESYVDKMDRGGKLIETSSFIKSKIYISRAVIEVNNTCDKKCAFCNEDNEIPCLSCYRESLDNSAVIDMKIIEKFWSDLNEIFVAEVLLTGGNPFRNFDIIKSIVNVINLRRQKPQIFIVCNEDLSLKNIEFLQKYNITLVINLVKSDEIYLNKMETFIKLLQNYGVKYVLYKRVNVERFEFASQSHLISDIVRKNETIVSKDNIVRNSSLNVNSLIGLKNICTLGKVLLHINGKLSVCKEYQGEENNVLSQNAINTTLTFEEVWNKAFPTEKCQSCNLKKICVNCPGILEKYSNYSNFCFV